MAYLVALDNIMSFKVQTLNYRSDRAQIAFHFGNAIQVQSIFSLKGILNVLVNLHTSM